MLLFQNLKFGLDKPFLTYQQQIQKLIYEKHLIIKDVVFAEQRLRDIGYFTLIGGYKSLFRNPMTRVFSSDTTFEDIYALYQFDNQLRELIFRYLLPKEDFLYFKSRLASLIDRYIKNSQRLNRSQLLGAMGFPVNWKTIARYKL